MSSARENFLISFKSKLFPIKEHEQAPEQAPKEKKSEIKLPREFINELKLMKNI